MSYIEKIKKVITDLDQFGVVFKPSITDKSEYKTFIGGTLSILLYGVSLSYFIYQFILWTQGNMLPRITQSSEIINYQSITFEEPLFSIQMRKYIDTIIDPFDPNNLVLLPIIIRVVNGQLILPFSLPQIDKTQNDDEFTTIYFQNITLAISQVQDTEYPEVEFQILIVDCRSSLLNNTNYTCANSTIKEQFFEQSLNLIHFNTYINQFDAQSKQVNTFPNQITLAIDIDTTYFATNTLKVQETYIDDGILFENNYVKDFILDISTASQQVSSTFFSKVLNITTYFINSYQLNGVKSIQYIQYPKINEVLADTGSIVSILLLTSAFVVMTNQYFLEHEAIYKVISMYYPKFKTLKYIKNWYGKIIKIELCDQQLEINKFQNYYQQLKEVALKKLTLTNQIYEISRIQFILQSILPRESLLFSHEIGIKELYFIENCKQQNYSSDKSNLNIKIAPIIGNSKDDDQSMNQIIQKEEELVQNNDITPDNYQQEQIKMETCQTEEQQLLIEQDFQLLINKKREINEQKLFPYFFEINKIN